MNFYFRESLALLENGVIGTRTATRRPRVIAFSWRAIAYNYASNAIQINYQKPSFLIAGKSSQAK
jgi:hypothetical protein